MKNKDLALQDITEKKLISLAGEDERFWAWYRTLPGDKDKLEYYIKQWLEMEVEEIPKWVFNEKEKIILSSIDVCWKWIVRSAAGRLYLFLNKPEKGVVWTDFKANVSSDLVPFNHLFQQIKWEDEEPCEFRKYI